VAEEPEKPSGAPMQPTSAVRPDAGLQELADERLMEIVVAGNKAAFDVLVQRHKVRLYSYVLRLLRDPTEAEDVTQEAFVRAYVHADKYRNIARFTTWLYTIATNLVRNRIRKTRSSPRLLSIQAGRWEDDSEEREAIELRDGGDLPDRTLEKRELHALVTNGIEAIPARYREAFVLREVNNYSYEEIAAITGLKLGTVRSRINRGRGHFRDIMTPVLKRLRGGPGPSSEGGVA
jgi:RNA polymerase sigma-70 factor (ECF subfamily)